MMQVSNAASVYIKDDAYSWLPARIFEKGKDGTVKVTITIPQDWRETTVLSPDSTVLDLEEAMAQPGTEILVVYRTVDLCDYDRGELPFQNLDVRGNLLGKRDMADLPFLHEAAILYNLKQRHANLQPYTRVGDIVVAMNPFRWIHNLYSDETRELYSRNLIWNDQRQESDQENIVSTFGSLYDKLGFDPHVYESSSLAYRGLAVEQNNQTILVTGESGAGKTETVKIVMSHLATLENTRPGGHPLDYNGHSMIGRTDTVKRVLESSPVFEAFGNAKTLRNDNSSRFGKFTQLQFDVEPIDAAKEKGRAIPVCQLGGSKCITYLLEKSRVVSHSEGERTYHIFYQFLSADDEFKINIWSELAGTTVDSFLYVGDHQVIEGEPDNQQWPITLASLKLFQFEGETLKTLLRALCVVLQLGNLTFEEDTTTDSEEGGTVISSKDELAKLSGLICVDADEIEMSMTTRILRTSYDIVHVRLRPSVAKESCDALAKEIYARIFAVIVRNINEYTRAEAHFQDEKTFGEISLLDIFGFERFKINRFEQLCINYANEQLHHKYVLDNFQQVKDEYQSEGIDIFDFRMVDNSAVLNLLESRLGLIISLNEECVRPKGSDESFVYKIKIVHQDHDRLIDDKLHLRTEFGIRHFAGHVTYNADRFVERNTDKLPEDLLRTVSKSSNLLIRTEFESLIAAETEETDTPGARRKKATSKTVLQKFRGQLQDLMMNMEGTTTRYIRCIKPNDMLAPKLTDHYTTMRQLECAGLVTALTISRESFPNKLAYELTKERFNFLMTKLDHDYMSGIPVKDAVQYMLSNLLYSMVEEHPNGTLTLPFACGKTRVYFRAGALEHLETKRLDYYTQRVVTIQAWTRKLQAVNKMEEVRAAVIKIQATARGRLEWKHYRKQQHASIALSSWFRGRQATFLVQSMRKQRAATVLQSRFRAKSKRYALRRFKRGAIIIQRAFRNKERRSKITAKMAIAVEEARMDHKLLGLKEKISLASCANTAAQQKASPASVKGRQVNDELLGEIENMFEYLRGEIVMLRGKNSDLKAELVYTEIDKRELLAHAESAEVAASSARLRVAALTKSNAALMSEILEHKHEAVHLRKELRTQSFSRQEELAVAKADYDRILKERDIEIRNLQVTIKQGRNDFEVDKIQLKNQITKLQEERINEVLRLKDELRRTQDSHHDYLAKLMDVLETTHAARESETARISSELHAIKEDKDAQIRSLQREVETLRELNRSDASALQIQMKGKEKEVASVRRELDRNLVARGQRGIKFHEVSSKLRELVTPENLVAITSARRGRGKKLSVVEEESQRMEKMIRFLDDLYSLEENSQAKVDSDILRMIDRYKAASAPNRALNELQFLIKQFELENARLKEQVRLNGNCGRCEARDNRRAARQHSAASNIPRSPDNSSFGRHEEERGKSMQGNIRNRRS